LSSAGSLDPATLTGRGERHLCSAAEAEELGAAMHQAVVAPFRALRDDARAAGFELVLDSGFRSFEQQLTIWNRKAAGKRPVLDSAAVPLDIGKLSEWELARAILRWSALPGASRHHWGTDLDVYDESARPAGYDVELIPAEVDPGGIFGPLHEWLDTRMARGTAHGFFRPYDKDRAGVAPERWHLSHGPVAAEFEAKLTIEVLRDTVESAEMLLKQAVLEHLDEIWERFVVNTARRPDGSRAS
jgi:LAS superfamily LD-carboxypeptidase LdcB